MLLTCDKIQLRDTGLTRELMVTTLIKKFHAFIRPNIYRPSQKCYTIYFIQTSLDLIYTENV
jgi:hypothetical protein